MDDELISKKRRIAAGALCERAEENISRVLADGARLYVLDDADDLVGHATAIDVSADGILCTEEMLSKGLIDDGDFRSVRGFIGEVATR